MASYNPEADAEIRRLRMVIEKKDIEIERLQERLSRFVRPATKKPPVQVKKASKYQVLVKHYGIRGVGAAILEELSCGHPVSNERLHDLIKDLGMGESTDPIKLLHTHMCYLRRDLKYRRSTARISTLCGEGYLLSAGVQEVQEVLRGEG